MTDSTNSNSKKTETKSHKKWEYTYQNIGANVDTLNQLGEQGWEIVNIDRSWVLFKREKFD